MKKSKLLLIFLMPFFAFLISISNVYAVDGDDAGDKDVDVDIDEGEGSTGTGNCSSLNNTVCRASGNSSYPQYLYASLTNPATKSNGVVVASSNSKVDANVSYLNGEHDRITATRDSVCTFLSQHFGIDCTSDRICTENIEYVYFSISAPVWINRVLYTDYTVKEIAAGCGNQWTCKSNSGFRSMSFYFHVVNSNAGVYSVAASKTSDTALIASIASGYGVAAIRLKDYGIDCDDDEEPPPPEICPGNGIAQTGSLNQCVDDNYGTQSTFRDMVMGSGTDSINGIREYDIGGEGTGYCSLYCMEINATANLPGGFANAITLGSGIVWPTSPGTWTSEYGNMFPLTFHGTRRCYVQVAPNLTYGRMCQINPVEDYENARTELNEAKNDSRDSAGNNSSLYNRASKANNDYTGNKSVYGFPISLQKFSRATSYLNKKNEEIRTLSFNNLCYRFSNSATYLQGDYFTTPENGCADASFWNDYLTKATNNYNQASSVYNSAQNKWRNENIENANYHDGCPASGIGTCHPYYTCDDGYDLNGRKCKPTEETARNRNSSINWAYKAKNIWSEVVSKLNSKYSSFKNYIEKYRSATNVYLKVKMCSDYSKEEMSCSGSFCTYYNFVTGATMEYEELEENGNPTWIGPLEVEQDVNYSCDRCGTELAPMQKKSYLYLKYDNLISENEGMLQSYIDTIEGSPITMESGEVVYSLPSSVQNAYINKQTLEVSDDIPSDTNKILNAFRNLPTSFNNEVGRQYKLVLHDITLGHNGIMSPANSWLNLRSDYICHYEVTTTNDECLCPPGTKNWGIDLFEAVLEDGITCADAKEKYCDADNVPECTVNCFEDKYCPDDYTTKISGCINSGKSRDWCINELCSGFSGIAYRCPSNSHNANMDITTCVEMKKSQGYSTNESKAYCERTICELDNIVIYRTIDLSNPFPSIDADGTVTQGGLRVGMFNLNVKGRYPGYNWNGTLLVNDKIINNRGEDNDDVYNTEPLYHFELNSATILNIRDYNRRQSSSGGYNDFTLECVRDESNQYVGTACLSRNFGHNPN